MKNSKSHTIPKLLKKNIKKTLELLMHKISVGGASYENAQSYDAVLPFFEEEDIFLILDQEDYKDHDLSRKGLMESLRFLVEKEFLIDQKRVLSTKFEEEVLNADRWRRDPEAWILGAYFITLDTKTIEGIKKYLQEILYKKTNTFHINTESKNLIFSSGTRISFKSGKYGGQFDILDSMIKSLSEEDLEYGIEVKISNIIDNLLYKEETNKIKMKSRINRLSARLNKILDDEFMILSGDTLQINKKYTFRSD
jgi:hypothetical protein